MYTIIIIFLEVKKVFLILELIIQTHFSINYIIYDIFIHLHLLGSFQSPSLTF